MYLEQLSNAFGVSSVEDDIREIVLNAAKPYCDAWRVDTMGNLFISRRHRQEPNGSLKRVMVTAHMDEVGFMITAVNNNGTLQFQAVGGFDPRVLLGKQLVIGEKRLPGVIGLKPIHLLKNGEWARVGAVDSMYIDAGATSKSNSKIKPGEFATFATLYGELGSGEEPALTEGRVKGKAFDNRVGCAVLLELLQADYPFDFEAVFTVQEEVGTRGAKIAAYQTNPDIALILECTAADDLPRDDEETEAGIPCLGHGPAITVMDGSFIANRQLVDWLIQTAEEADIPYQFKRPGVGGTDAGAIHLAREGIPCAVVSVPSRYIHSPASVLELSDFWHTVRLVQTALQNPPKIASA